MRHFLTILALLLALPLSAQEPADPDAARDARFAARALSTALQTESIEAAFVGTDVDGTTLSGTLKATFENDASWVLEGDLWEDVTRVVVIPGKAPAAFAGEQPAPLPDAWSWISLGFPAVPRTPIVDWSMTILSRPMLKSDVADSAESSHSSLDPRGGLSQRKDNTSLPALYEVEYRAEDSTHAIAAMIATVREGDMTLTALVVSLRNGSEYRIQFTNVQRTLRAD
jgi:hypothetical protein